MRQSEFKQQYDPNLDKYVMKHVYDGTMWGEGMSDVFKAVGNIAKNIAKTTAKSAATKAATKTGEYAGKKAGDKIVELLKKNKTTVTPVMTSSTSESEPKELNPDEINNRVNMLLSGGKLRKRNFI